MGDFDIISEFCLLILHLVSTCLAMINQGRLGKDETIEDAAQCETVEEAGVQVQTGRGRWYFENKTGDIAYEGHMFPLLVTGRLDSWPEKEIRQRTWCKLLRWHFENKAGDTAYEGHMFPLFVTEQLDCVRTRFAKELGCIP
ncbi:nudix hydrolase 18, mitochondrial-like isoform X2 [Lycium ferocissimum]|uniref:nudix hydrolase 18, mitochondrial-like isoform X2 n=1 Tax=Lycium ferocissimum TaxID=112874 RepID=UPI002815DCAA|nr:nudix hydrolase 18, mitochondrial-like isoform X2 [Lycium ferocissimum]